MRTCKALKFLLEIIEIQLESESSALSQAGHAEDAVNCNNVSRGKVSKQAIPGIIQKIEIYPRFDLTGKSLTNLWQFNASKRR